MKTIVCYGDSNTWGYVPNTQGERYDLHTRWPGVLRDTLGDGWWVIEEGLSGRTTVHDDPLEPGRCGKDYLMPCLLSQRPLDILIILLGTNDLKRRFDLPPSDIALGAQLLAEMALASPTGSSGGPPAVILICPPPLAPLEPLADLWISEMFEGGYEKSLRLASHYRRAAAVIGCDFINSGDVIASDPAEGIHWQPDAHRTLGHHVADYIRRHFGSPG